jgi:hypothetical protein
MGLQAQVMAAAEMAVNGRVEGLSPRDVQDALWKDHSLVKTWAMRQTLHLLPAADLPLYVAARRITEINWPALFTRAGIDRALVDRYYAIGPEILSGEPITRQQFAEQVGGCLKSPELRDFLINRSWGVPLKPLAWRGELCFGPSDGQNVTFVRPRAWIGERESIEPEAAMSEIVRRYLQAYGPARPENFQLWWGTYIGDAAKAFNSIANELEDVDIEGWQAKALRTFVPSIRSMEPTGAVHLLPMFDAFTIGLTRGKFFQRLLSPENQKKVYRAQGWISAVVLVDGFIKGTWEYKIQRSKTTVLVNLFSTLTDGTREKIATEADRLGKFLNSPVELEFTQQ